MGGAIWGKAKLALWALSCRLLVTILLPCQWSLSSYHSLFSVATILRGQALSQREKAINNVVECHTLPDNKQAMCPPAGTRPQQPGRLPAQGQCLPREQRSSQTPSEQVVEDQLDEWGAEQARLNLWKRGLDLKIWAGEVGRGAAGGRHLILFFKRYLHFTHIIWIIPKLQSAFKKRGAR